MGSAAGLPAKWRMIKKFIYSSLTPTVATQWVFSLLHSIEFEPMLIKFHLLLA
jgi:hypothetical protein